ncbi:MAG: M6 family metalloprotease domain-containing protein [Bacteroidota bacterium]
MKRYFTITLLSLLLVGTSPLFAQRSNCGVSPEPNTFTQKDGSEITVFAYGNEQEHYLETKDGYTILANSEGVFEYATIDNTGNLVPSGIKANNKVTFKGKATPEKHLRYSHSQKAILAEIFTQLESKPGLGKKAPQGFPNKGVNKVCVLLIQYPDLLATIDKTVYQNLFNQVNYTSTGSFRDYYLKTSYGQLTLNSDVYGWYTADNGYKFYGKNNVNYSANTRALVRDAVESADSAGVDFSAYDNDLDGEVDGLLILHSGIGAEEQSAPNANDYIWSFRSSLGSGSVVTNAGVSVNSYCMFPEKRYNGGSYTAVGIGVISHEFGHILDLPDLYSTQSRGEGAGNFTNMAGGPWLNNEKTPCLFDAWSKSVMEWLQPTVISQNGTYTIKKAAVDSNFCYRINTPKANEYFLLENKQLKGFDRYIPGKGLAIWHINTNTARLLSQGGGNNVNNDTSKYGMGLVQADGLRGLEKATNRGDGGDLFPGTTTNRSFSGTTNPSSALYPTTSGGVRASSNVVISNITLNADSSITFTLGNKASASYSAASLNGCVPYTVTLNNNSLFANKYKWIFADSIGESFETNPTHVFTQKGSYKVTLYVLDSIDNIVDSNSQTFVINESPKAAALINRLGPDSFLLTNTSTNYDFVTWRFGSSSNSSQEPVILKASSPGKMSAMLIAYKATCTDTFNFELDIYNLGINEFSLLQNVSVFPNPFTNQLMVDIESLSSGDATVTMSNIIGQQIFAKEIALSKGKNTLDLSNEIGTQMQGTYFLTIKANDSFFVYKVLKINR